MKPTHESITSTAVKAIDNALGNSISEIIEKLRNNDLIDDESAEELEFLIQEAIDKTIYKFHTKPVE